MYVVLRLRYFTVPTIAFTPNIAASSACDSLTSDREAWFSKCLIRIPPASIIVQRLNKALLAKHHLASLFAQANRAG
ncbi:hypothetical protein T440DRAFT_470722 [Plenodomus tracheiphilus IPT5]|uniref:Uncharacterized protein n=1 Tax=Plenodomus tracheiphilus IPT5 TaxID=1408161 RepID=A0A6A7B0H4_9PLEO|nr:hypothetical protein T440DRAFT_470722 [Plenodomus tracheiphilus IPT5]